MTTAVTNSTLSNGFRLLEHMAARGGWQRVTELARDLDLPKSHVCRLLKTLADVGYVEQDTATRRYAISLKTLWLSNTLLRGLSIRNRLRPALQSLAGQTGRPGYLLVPTDDGPLVVDVVHPDGFTDDPGVVLGELLPVTTSASGKLFAALLENFGSEQVRAEVGSSTGARRFRSSLDGVERKGVAVADGERGPNVYAAAAPVTDAAGECVAAIGAASFDEKLSAAAKRRLARAVRDAAQAHSAADDEVA